MATILGPAAVGGNGLPARTYNVRDGADGSSAKIRATRHTDGATQDTPVAVVVSVSEPARLAGTGANIPSLRDLGDPGERIAAAVTDTLLQRLYAGTDPHGTAGVVDLRA